MWLVHVACTWDYRVVIFNFLYFVEAETYSVLSIKNIVFIILC